jgi:S1-C subfamily serine protease
MKSPRELQTIANILGGVPILGVLPGSTADRAGLRYGDIVTRVNGLPTTTFEQFLLAHDQSAGQLALEVFRNGESLSFDMALARRNRHEERDPSPTSRNRIARRVVNEPLPLSKLS